MAAGESTSQAFEISLPFDADSGVAPIRADFKIDAEREYRFSVFRELNVGDAEIELETSTQIDQDGALLVEQRMVNHGPELADFKCYLTVDGRRRQRMQVFRLGGTPDVKVYRYPGGAELTNKEFWLQVVEVNGSRVLNHKFVAEQ